ncbi:MAG TPA: hypothetical protein VF765_24815 [Polyangiaceae bacterium]
MYEPPVEVFCVASEVLPLWMVPYAVAGVGETIAHQPERRPRSGAGGALDARLPVSVGLLELALRRDRAREDAAVGGLGRRDDEVAVLDDVGRSTVADGARLRGAGEMAVQYTLVASTRRALTRMRSCSECAWTQS